MNLLTEPLPSTVIVGGQACPIKTDFRAGVAFECIILDPELSDQEKAIRALELYYGMGKIPEDHNAALEAAVRFYCCGKEPEQDDAKNATPTGKGPLYDFETDAPLIIAAFWQQYNIDLTAEGLHWWTFKALLRGLTEETLFIRVVGWRGEDIDPKAPAKERERLAKLKRLYALPERRSAADQAAKDALLQALMHGGDVSGLLKREGET